MKTKTKIILASILSKLITTFIAKNQNVKRNNLRWNLDLNEGIDLSIFLFGTSEKKIFNLKKLLKESSSPIIIDIGANIGSTSLIMAKMFNDCKIFAIEPTDYAFNKLRGNLELNKEIKNKLFLRQLFITNNKEPKKVWSSWNFQNSKNSHKKHLGTLKDIKPNSYVGLEQFINDEKITNVDFIKIDVDGYELDVLKSGEKFLTDNKPIIFIEIAPYLYSEFGYNCDELIQYIINLKYDFYDENIKKISNIFDIVNNIKDGSSKNFFLI
ncbi:FkbM family methyltransferase [Candidatus Pelagibacter sp.]|nr:FkbM family methyltransferase [Candidatus Pelagibacter sp.]